MNLQTPVETMTSPQLNTRIAPCRSYATLSIPATLQAGSLFECLVVEMARIELASEAFSNPLHTVRTYGANLAACLHHRVREGADSSLKKEAAEAALSRSESLRKHLSMVGSSCKRQSPWMAITPPNKLSQSRGKPHKGYRLGYDLGRGRLSRYCCHSGRRRS